MRGTLLLAYRYMTFHRGRTLILVLAVGLTLFLPLATHWTIEKFRDRAFHRAAATPLVVGSKGSRFGLAMHALYFRGESPSSLPMSQLTRIDAMGLGKTIPMLVNFRAGGFPIVGTTDEYLRFRDLKLSVGQPMSRLGDCLLGANVARALELKTGDRLQSEPENMFDITGPSPLSMRVTGVLMSTSTADDDVVLCDLKTAWIIQGIGHGHAMAETKTDERVVPESVDEAQHKHAASRENMQAVTEITDANVRSFHFHGRRDDYPLTAIVVLPNSEKATTLLLGKYLATDEPYQIIQPTQVVGELMEAIGQVRRVIDALSILLLVAAGLLVGLVMLLSLKLRQGEMRALTLIGCSRGTMLRIVSTELVLVLAVGFGLAFCTASVLNQYSDRFVLDAVTVE